MKTTINFEQTQSLESEITDAVFQMINTAIIAITPQNIADEMSFISNRDLGDEDPTDLFD
ncbi:MAG: hypothetical protein LH473_02025 [Chitinophagales bacterium]|nr:hypothetical protein [Chitinophagales bacterium]